MENKLDPGEHHHLDHPPKLSKVVDPLLGPVSRAYRLHLPAHWPMSNDVPRPLVVDFPGWTENMIGHERDSMFYVVADEDEEGGFLLVTPKGMGDVGDGKVE